MAVNQAEIIQDLEKAIGHKNQSEFVYEFLSAFKLPKNTITSLKNNTNNRNVASIEGDIALKKQVYFRIITNDQSVFDVAEDLLKSQDVEKHAIRFVIVTNLEDFVAYDRKVDDRMECPLSELHRHYSFFLPLAGHEKAIAYEETAADIRAADKMGALM